MTMTRPRSRASLRNTSKASEGDPCNPPVSPLVCYLGKLLLEVSLEVSDDATVPTLPSKDTPTSAPTSAHANTTKTNNKNRNRRSFKLVVDNARVHAKEAWVQHHNHRRHTIQQDCLTGFDMSSLVMVVPRVSSCPTIMVMTPAPAPAPAPVPCASSSTSTTAGSTNSATGSVHVSSLAANGTRFLSRVASTGGLCRWDSAGGLAALAVTPKADLAVKKPQRISDSMEDESHTSTDHTSTATDHSAPLLHHDDGDDFGEFCLLSDDEEDDFHSKAAGNNTNPLNWNSNPSPFLKDAALRWQ